MSIFNAGASSVGPPPGIETYQQKFIRRFKEEPLVPLGAAATTAALIIAMTKMRRGQSKSFNNWLRVRIIAQGLTIGAVAAGSFAFGRTKQQQDAAAAAAAAAAAGHEPETAAVPLVDTEREMERREFEKRMRAAEEAHEWEVRHGGAAPAEIRASDVVEPGERKGKPRGWWASLGLSGSASAATVAKASEPAIPKPEVKPAPTSTRVAGGEAETTRGGGIWQWIGWGSGSSEKKG